MMEKSKHVLRAAVRNRRKRMGLAFMVDREILPTDFTRFRRMNERSDKVGEMSKEQAAVFGALLKLI